MPRPSLATIDRRLGPSRSVLMTRGRTHTKPGTLLKSQIPIRTWSEWSEETLGFVEIDLVGHEGPTAVLIWARCPCCTDCRRGQCIRRHQGALPELNAGSGARRVLPHQEDVARTKMQTSISPDVDDVQAIIGVARPLIASVGSQVRLEVAGGEGA